jgi:hypothetical protein
MREDPSQKKTTRRDVLKLAGAAALGAAGSVALGAPRVLAAGSGNTIGMYFSPGACTRHPRERQNRPRRGDDRRPVPLPRLDDVHLGGLLRHHRQHNGGVADRRRISVGQAI